jgi:hypothetical protein
VEIRMTEQPSWWRSRIGIATLGFLAVTAFYLLTEHTAHVFGALPYMLLAACPLMHLFHHRDHRHGSGHRRDADKHPSRRDTGDTSKISEKEAAL